MYVKSVFSDECMSLYWFGVIRLYRATVLLFRSVCSCCSGAKCETSGFEVEKLGDPEPLSPLVSLKYSWPSWWAINEYWWLPL